MNSAPSRAASSSSASSRSSGATVANSGSNSACRSGRGPTDHVSSVRTRARVTRVGGALDHLAQPVARAGRADRRLRPAEVVQHGEPRIGRRRLGQCAGEQSRADRGSAAGDGAAAGVGEDVGGAHVPGRFGLEQVHRDAFGRRAGLLEQPRRRLVEPQALAGGDGAKDRGAQQGMREAQLVIEQPGEHERVRGGARRGGREPGDVRGEGERGAVTDGGERAGQCRRVGPEPREPRSDRPGDVRRVDRRDLRRPFARRAHPVRAQRPEEIDEQERVAAGGGEARGDERVVRRLAQTLGDERRRPLPR